MLLNLILFVLFIIPTCYISIPDEETTSKNEEDWTVIVGEHDLFNPDDTEQVRWVKKIIIHPQNFRYRDLNLPGLQHTPDDYDLGMLSPPFHHMIKYQYIFSLFY